MDHSEHLELEIFRRCLLLVMIGILWPVGGSCLPNTLKESGKFVVIIWLISRTPFDRKLLSRAVRTKHASMEVLLKYPRNLML